MAREGVALATENNGVKVGRQETHTVSPFSKLQPSFAIDHGRVHNQIPGLAEGEDAGEEGS